MARPKTKSLIKKIKKRDGRIVSFKIQKIARAIWLAAKAAGGKNRAQAKYLAGLVGKELEKRFNQTIIPEVEQVQDIVEKTLLKKGHEKTHQAYILYRELHSKMRDITSLVDSDELIKKYLNKVSWLVKENANMTYSLQGLNNHVASLISTNFWLNQIYPRKIRKAHLYGDIHIHNLALLSAYCTGWDLKDLLIRGFGGVPGKIFSAPPKHFATALGQLVNFFYTLQGEVAGAVAVADFDTYLAPFIAYDKLSYQEVKQQMQEFVYNMNVPTRVGFQCISEDTEILTADGWKNYEGVEKGTIIKTFNIKTQEIEEQKVDYIFKKQYQGRMYNLKNRIQDQLVSPKHRVVRKKFNSQNFVLEPIEEVNKLKSAIITPIAGQNCHKKADIYEEQIKLMAWIISEGAIERATKYRCCYRVSIYQSKIKNKANYEEIKKLLDYFKFNYSIYETASLGAQVTRFRLNAESSKIIHKWFGTKENIKFIPKVLFNLDQKQSRLFLKTYLRADGFEDYKIAVANLDLLDDLQEMIVNCGYGFTVLNRGATAIGKKDIYVLRIIRHKETYIQEIKKIKYKGLIWSPHTKNETIIARRKGKVFITGNTPFTNVTLDLTPPKTVGEEVVIIGGKPVKSHYKDFQKEMDLFNRAFAEVMIEGDAHGRVFTFPIPTYSISKDFNWDNPVLEPIFEMTRKYGIPYWANYVNSDMKPEDARSMCPIAGKEKVLIKSSRGRELEYSEIRNVYEGHSHQKEYEAYSDGKFVKGRFNKFENQKMIKVTLRNGHQLEQSVNHLNFVMENFESKEEKVLKGEELKPGMYLPYSLKAFVGHGGNKDLGYFVGAYAGDGSFDSDNTVIFSLENERKKEVIKRLEKIARDYFGAHIATKSYPNSKLFTLKIHSKAAVGLCKDFVAGKKRGKHYKARLFSASLEFRKGIIEGHYATDGGNRNRIYTSSPKMVESLNILAATLGTTTSIYKDERQGRLGKEPNYAVLIYQLNRKKYGKFWFKRNNKLWIKIKSIKKLAKTTAYCFEVKNDKPMFTVGTTGILTHNCRLRLDNRVLRKRGGLFAANPLTGCYDEKTEILTKSGWKLFSKLTKKDKVFTLTKNNKLEIHRPTRLFEYDWNGDLIRFKARSLDLLVTPNHRMVIDTTNKVRKFVEAQDFDVNNHRIPKEAIWEAEEKKWFVLPSIKIIKYGRQGRTPYEVVRNSWKIKMNDWLAFLGIWLAEGSADNEKIAKSHGYRITISQSKKKEKEEIRELLERLPFNYFQEREDLFVICNKQLWTYLRQFGKAKDKYISEEFKQLNKKQLKILFNWMVKGDGHVRKTTRQINYWTASKKLADDMQEIIIKLGFSSSISQRKKKGSIIKGRKIKAGISYCISVLKSKHHRLRKRNILKEFYKGKVYCCTVKNNTLLVRRNGKVCWSGNSIGVVTINLPRIGYLAKTKREFFQRLKKLMKISRDSLIIKRKIVEEFTQKGLYPYCRYYLSDVYQRKARYWMNHFNTIGIIGMNEALENFLGKSITDKEGQNFALEVMRFMRKELLKYQKSTGLLFNLEASPAEGTSYSLAKIDQKRFPEIITSGTKERPFYTNSTHLPVDYTNDIFEALDNQDELQCTYNGGTVFHGFLGESLPDTKSVKNLIKKISFNYHLPYFTLTPTFSICPKHGYIPGNHKYCPKCDEEIGWKGGENEGKSQKK